MIDWIGINSRFTKASWPCNGLSPMLFAVSSMSHLAGMLFIFSCDDRPPSLWTNFDQIPWFPVFNPSDLVCKEAHQQVKGQQMEVPSSTNLLTSSKDASVSANSPKCQQCTSGHRDRHHALCSAQPRRRKLPGGVPVSKNFSECSNAEARCSWKHVAG